MPLESVTVKTCAPESPARTQTAIQLPAVLLEVKAKDADVVVPASMLVVCTNLMVTTATVKVTPLLATPPTVTTTFPVVAPEGTGTTMLVLPQVVGDAVVLLNVTVLVPCVEPKFVPLMVTDVPTGPAVGLTPEMFGVGLPPPLAGLKAARTAPQLLEADSVAEAATV